MTNNEAYSLGWAYGKIYATLGFPEYDMDGLKFEQAGFNPVVGLALIHREAMRRRTLTDAIEMDIARAVGGISPVADNYRAELPLVGSWQLGYYCGKSGRALPMENWSIESARRAKDYSQQQLAEKMGVAQSVISRWESGEVSPNSENLLKLHDVLD